ncbi:pyridoxal phosphate-dependent aminotransferase [Halosquirtibacter laminarini]|uniref:Pyridoxal phosphate-dependent aminotransferase n=1 Tax=Halosquirtibacter laminarini TaxID=3374600 RepID=A0AC61NHS0_9BACT|nr:pyridoxal phosphate-dependent aminotransferase [Prolixibacteraceae bacterium]
MSNIEYNFDSIIDRKNTNCLKYDALNQFFGEDNLQPFWVADTDFETPNFIIDKIKERLEHPALGYTFKPDNFFQTITDWQKRQHQWEIENSWISTTPGVVSGIASSILAFTEKQDKIIINTPVYYPFYATIEGLERTILRNPLKLQDNRYQIDIEHFEQLAQEGAKMFVLCNPHNPGGTVWSKKELQAIGDICVRHNIIIVSDEIHSDLILGERKHTPIASISKKISDKTITLMAPSKTFNIAGLATSFVICSNRKIRTTLDRTIYAVHIHGGNLLGNIACEAAYEYGEEWVGKLIDYLASNCELAIQFLKQELPELKIMKPDATYLLWIDFNAYGDEKEMEKRLKEIAKVALNKGSSFGEEGKGYFRFNFGCPREVMIEGLNKIVSAFKN